VQTRRAPRGGAMEEELSQLGEATSQGETVVGEEKCVPGAEEFPQQSTERTRSSSLMGPQGNPLWGTDSNHR
jgi:hypothetical protein